MQTQVAADAMAQAEPVTSDQQTPPPKGDDSEQVTLKLRKNILLLASMVATMTYAAGFSPPGDVWQDTAGGHIAGDPILRETHHRRYLTFFYCNATAFAASLVVIVITLTLAYLDDHKDKEKYKKRQPIAVRTLQLAMVLDLLSLMGAYAAGTCRDTFTKVYSSLLVSFVFFYVIVQVVWATGSCGCCGGGEEELSGGGGDEEGLKAMFFRVLRYLIPKLREGVEEQGKANDRFRKVQMLLATFAVSVTYSAGLSTPGGFWDTAGRGHRPGDAILRDRHGIRLAVFLVFNTLAFVASLLIIVVLMDTKLRQLNAYSFIVVALVSLIIAYNAGSCRHTDTTVYVFGLIPAVLLYISIIYLLADHIRGIWKKLKSRVRTVWPKPARAVKTEEEAADKARSLVLLLATLAATITYQAGLVPPGGVWQDNSDSGGHTAGDPVLLTMRPRRYKAFYYCNSVSLVASLVAIVLVQKKLLLRHHVLEAVMILDLLGLIGSYAAGSCRDVNTSIHAMALAGAVLVYVVIHVILVTLDDDTCKCSDGDKEKDKDPVENTRKRLLLFAILAATITYQAGLTPPGGFLLQDDQSGHHAGDPVLLHNFPRRYKAFFYCNSVSFMLSIALIILLVNPNVYRPAIRAHALSVCTAAGLFGLIGAYAAGSTQHLKTSFYVFALIVVVLVCIGLLFLVFLLTSTSKGDTATTQVPAKEASSQVEASTRSNSNATPATSLTDGAKEPGTDSKDNTATTQESATQGPAMEAGSQVEASPPISNNNSTPAAASAQGATEETKPKDKEDGEKKKHVKRKYLMLLGILVASVTYQAGLAPPGGAWQSSSGGHEAGNSVMHDNRRPQYLAFFYSNSTSFMASVVVILLLLIQQQTPDEKSLDKWFVVMNTTVVVDLLGLLGAYAAGSSRRWKTSVHVLLLVIAVLIYMVFHLHLSSRRKRSRQSAQPLGGDSSAQSGAQLLLV